MTHRKLLIWIIVSAMTAVCVLSSCGAAEKKADAGRRIMEEWLSVNRPGAEIQSASNRITDTQTRKNYLTDYVEGTYLYDSKEHRFIVDVLHNTVFTSERYEEFLNEAESYLREVLSLDDRYDIQSFDAKLMFPEVSSGDPYKSRDEVFTAAVVPADITVIRDYLTSDGRLPVSIDAEILVSENGYMSQFDLKDLIKSKGGIYYHRLFMTGGHDEILNFTGNTGSYERWAQIKVGDFRLYGQTAYKSAERLDSSATLEINSVEENYDYSKDVHITQTADGLQIRFEQSGVNPAFCLFAAEDSEICRTGYTLQREDDEKGSNICIWGNAEDGFRELLNDDGTRLYINYDCSLLITG